MFERRLPRVFEGFSTLVRKCCRLCGVGQRQLVGCERRLARSSICGEKARRRLVVPAAQTSAPLRSEGGRNSQAIGGFDISMNEHANGKFASHWRPHAWVFVATKDPKELKVCLKKEFPVSKQVRRPVQVVPFDYSLTGLAYAMKSDFSRRVSLPHKRKGHLMIRRNTRNRPLRSMQKVELAVALHDAGLADRLF